MTNLSQSPASPGVAEGPGKSAAVLPIVCTAIALASLDLFVVNVALPDIGADLGDGDLSKLSWLINGYAITYAALLVLFGRLAERHARDRAFLVGVAAFVGASALCALAPNLDVLIAGRVLQAAGAALLTPTSLGLILATTPGPRRAAAVRAWTAVGGVAAAVGPIVGGLLVAASWRWVFLINLPIGIVAIVAGLRLLPRVPGTPVRRPDAVGAALVTVAVGLLAAVLVQGESWGWTTARTVAAVGIGVVAGGAFVVRCLRRDNPLIDPALFRVRSFRGASVVVTVFTAAFGAMLLSIILWCQQVWGWSALSTGLAVAPGPLMVPLFAFVIVGPLIARGSTATVTVLGAAVFAAGTAWWATFVDLEVEYVSAVLPGMLLTGAGVGLTLPTLMGAATASLPPSALATGSAVVNMVRQIGLAVGVAGLVAIIGAPDSPAGALSAFQRGWIATTAAAALTGLLAWVLLPERPGLAPDPVAAVPGGAP